MQDRACRRDGARCGKIPHTIRDPMLFPGLLAHKKFPSRFFCNRLLNTGKTISFLTVWSEYTEPGDELHMASRPICEVYRPERAGRSLPSCA